MVRHRTCLQQRRGGSGTATVYFSDEKEVDTGVLIRVYQVFSRDTTAVAYAAWFN
jgi:hypothetical protein